MTQWYPHHHHIPGWSPHSVRPNVLRKLRPLVRATVREPVDVATWKKRWIIDMQRGKANTQALLVLVYCWLYPSYTCSLALLSCLSLRSFLFGLILLEVKVLAAELGSREQPELQHRQWVITQKKLGYDLCMSKRMIYIKPKKDRWINTCVYIYRYR